MHVEGLGRPVPGVTPHPFEQLLAGHHGTGVLGQHGQHIELLGGEHDLVAVHQHPAGTSIDLQAAGGAPVRLGGGLAPTGDGTNSGHQLAEAEGLDHVVVGAQLEAHHAVDLVAPRRQEDDGHVGQGPHPPAHLVAVDVGQADVEQHDVGNGGGDGLPAGGDVGHLEALPLETSHQRCGDGLVVFHQEDPHALVFTESLLSSPHLGWCREAMAHDHEGMERKRALAIASMVTGVALAAVLAIGATFGLFGLTENRDKAGTFDPASVTNPTVPEQTVVVDVPAPGPAVGPSGGPPPAGTTPASSASRATAGPTPTTNRPAATVTTIRQRDDSSGRVSNSGPGSSNSGPGSSNSGSGSSGSSGGGEPDDD